MGGLKTLETANTDQELEEFPQLQLLNQLENEIPVSETLILGQSYFKHLLDQNRLKPKIEDLKRNINEEKTVAIESRLRQIQAQIQNANLPKIQEIIEKLDENSGFYTLTLHSPISDNKKNFSESSASEIEAKIKQSFAGFFSRENVLKDEKGEKNLYRNLPALTIQKVPEKPVSGSINKLQDNIIELEAGKGFNHQKKNKIKLDRYRLFEKSGQLLNRNIKKQRYRNVFKDGETVREETEGGESTLTDNQARELGNYASKIGEHMESFSANWIYDPKTKKLSIQEIKQVDFSQKPELALLNSDKPILEGKALGSGVTTGKITIRNNKSQKKQVSEILVADNASQIRKDDLEDVSAVVLNQEESLERMEPLLEKNVKIIHGSGSATSKLHENQKATIKMIDGEAKIYNRCEKTEIDTGWVEKFKPLIDLDNGKLDTDALSSFNGYLESVKISEEEAKQEAARIYPEKLLLEMEDEIDIETVKECREKGLDNVKPVVPSTSLDKAEELKGLLKREDLAEEVYMAVSKPSNVFSASVLGELFDGFIFDLDGFADNLEEENYSQAVTTGLKRFVERARAQNSSVAVKIGQEVPKTVFDYLYELEVESVSLNEYTSEALSDWQPSEEQNMELDLESMIGAPANRVESVLEDHGALTAQKMLDHLPSKIDGGSLHQALGWLAKEGRIETKVKEGEVFYTLN